MRAVIEFVSVAERLPEIKLRFGSYAESDALLVVCGDGRVATATLLDLGDGPEWVSTARMTRRGFERHGLHRVTDWAPLPALPETHAGQHTTVPDGAATA